jgi:hypothetical protein
MNEHTFYKTLFDSKSIYKSALWCGFLNAESSVQHVQMSDDIPGIGIDQLELTDEILPCWCEAPFSICSCISDLESIDWRLR